MTGRALHDYSDRMLRPETPREYWVREGNRLIPIPVGRARPAERDEDQR